MAVFSYRALTAAGRTRGGVIDADSARAAWQALRTRGVYPTELREQAVGTPWRLRRVEAGELAAATRQLATLVEAGVPVAEALAAVADETQHPALLGALTVARVRLREGESLAAALAASPRVFPPLFRDLVAAGEASGALAAVLARLADHTEAAAAMRARLRAALLYPAVLSVATVGVLGFLVLWVVPELSALFEETGTPLPLATRLLVALTSLAGRTWALALPAVLAAGWAARRWLATPSGRARLDAALLGAPLVGAIVRRVVVARVARTLATLLAGGVPLEAALGIAAAGAGNRRAAGALGAVREAVRRGEPLAAALRASGIFPPLVVRLVAAGERGGSLTDMLDRAAASYEREVDQALGAATSLVEPALVLVMGAVVLALVTSVLLPLLDLGGLVR